MWELLDKQQQFALFFPRDSEGKVWIVRQTQNCEEKSRTDLFIFNSAAGKKLWEFWVYLAIPTFFFLFCIRKRWMLTWTLYCKKSQNSEFIARNLKFFLTILRKKAWIAWNKLRIVGGKVEPFKDFFLLLFCCWEKAITFIITIYPVAKTGFHNSQCGRGCVWKYEFS